MHTRVVVAVSRPVSKLQQCEVVLFRVCVDTHMLPFSVSIWFLELGQDLWITRSRGKLYISRVAKNSTFSSRHLQRLYVSKVAINMQTLVAAAGRKT